jgi:thiosulfate dehydrogenase
LNNEGRRAQDENWCGAWRMEKAVASDKAIGVLGGAIVMLLAAQALAQEPASKPKFEGLAEVPAAAAAPADAGPVTFDIRDIDSLPDDAWGRLVRYGRDLFTQTSGHIGPEASDTAMRYAGNNLRCQTCHLDAGTRPFAMALVGVYAGFPQYRGREDAIGTLEGRINGCMERSMNGRALPLGSRELKAMVSYMYFISEGVPIGTTVRGRGLMPFAPPDRAVDLARGERVFAEQCAACHAPDGQGVRAGEPGDGGGYTYPPLWGPDSYNTGAGMHRVLTAASFIQHNMPFGTTYESPVLSAEDAYDVAGYINNKPRPEKANTEADFPNRLKKPADCPYGPYADDFPQQQHKFGPFQPIKARLEELRREASAGK